MKKYLKKLDKTKFFKALFLVSLTTLPLLMGIILRVKDDSTENSVNGINNLSWAPPIGWEDYQRVSIEDAPAYMRSWSGSTCTSTNTNLIIELPDDVPYLNPISLEGGGNIVIIGGEIQIPWYGDIPVPWTSETNSTISRRRAIKIHDCAINQQPRTVHIEGLKIGVDNINANCSDAYGVRVNSDPNCSDLSEGIQIDAPNSIVQLQNIRINHLHARDQINFTDNHPDLIQTYGNVKELRIDKFTGHSDYQGFFFQTNFNGSHGVIKIKRTNLIAEQTGRYLFWVRPDPAAHDVTLEDFWIDVQPDKLDGLGRTVYPNIFAASPNTAIISTDSNGRQVATWSESMIPKVTGRITEGLPLGGDFVKDNEVGINYISPGYSFVDSVAPQRMPEGVPGYSIQPINTPPETINTSAIIRDNSYEASSVNQESQAVSPSSELITQLSGQDSPTSVDGLYPLEASGYNQSSDNIAEEKTPTDSQTIANLVQQEINTVPENTLNTESSQESIDEAAIANRALFFIIAMIIIIVFLLIKSDSSIKDNQPTNYPPVPNRPPSI